MKAKRVTKLKRVRNRVYGIDAETGREIVVTPAEYAVFRGAGQLARVVRMKDGWRVCVATAGSKLGEAISPVGLNKLKLLREWVEERWGD